MERTLMSRGDKRTAAKAQWFALKKPRDAAWFSFVDFWRSQNDDDHAARAAHQQKNSLKRRVK